MQINQMLVSKLQQMNDQLVEKYKYTARTQHEIRQKLRAADTHMHQMQVLSHVALKKTLRGRQVAAVDGSVNQTQGVAPHVLYVFQALAKTTTGVACTRSDVYVPLLEEREQLQQKRRSYLLSKLELEAAYTLLEQEEIGLLLMDGALYHYRIDAPEEWAQLVTLALARGTWLVGVSEEITTENLIRLPAFADVASDAYVYDRDLLFGVLQQNEMIFIKDIQHKAGLQSAWMRLGSTPTITGFDMLSEQAKDQQVVGDILCTLTPKEGRGIPLWLDYIDREVRVTDQLMEGLIEQYIDVTVKQKLFTAMRQNRPY
ncbi:DNA double-strand break repair nuclease NurA [Shouchella lonarensis]|uniref:NurA domain-containing protein n=1 Tax=Shouchella lonarensis TaxID=1464122 RepID=A0A1G6NZS8_9BACI|nr:DNA double-strand break repair nuclease NurA [Shouchella lonarensis]SDC73540.1 NurA domain-containing protein [Shouchella lonarensis]